VARQTRRLFNTVEVTRALRPVEPFLPPGFDVELSRIEDVELTVPNKADTVAPIRRALAVIEAADELRVVASTISVGALEATSRNEYAELVLSPAVLEFIDDNPEVRENLETILDAGWPVARLDRDLEYTLMIADETVMMTLNDDGVSVGLVETTDDCVYEWAVEQFEKHKRSATPVDVTTPSE
jgi:predicted transcriptional regulator